jgi:transcriptional regulator with XRE-family HTH domain
MENTNEYVGKQIRKFRMAAYLTRNDVADYLCMSTSAFGKLELGRTAITSDKIHKLSILFNKSVNLFFPRYNQLNSPFQSKSNEESIEKFKSKNKYILHLESEIVFLRQQIRHSHL